MFIDCENLICILRVTVDKSSQVNSGILFFILAFEKPIDLPTLNHRCLRL